MADDFAAWYAVFEDAFVRLNPRVSPSWVDMDSLRAAWKAGMSPVQCATQRAYKVHSSPPAPPAPPVAAPMAATGPGGWLPKLLRWAAFGVWGFGGLLAAATAYMAVYGATQSARMPQIPGVETPSAGPSVFGAMVSAGWLAALAAGYGGAFWYLSLRSEESR